LGDYYKVASSPRYITGRFNGHLQDCLLLHAEEGFWAGDHQAEGVLKDLITGDKHFLEYKNLEPIRVDNYVRLLVTGNPHWVVPAALDERRFAVLDMGTKHKQDHGYFAAIEDEMKKGGREALLDLLLNDVDLGKVNLRQIHKTAALFDQKIASMTPDEKFILGLLNQGVLPGDYDGNGQTPFKTLYDAYIANAKGQRYPLSDVQFGRKMKKLLPPYKRGRNVRYDVFVRWDQYGSPNKRERTGTVWRLPPLADCRAHFDNVVGATCPWPKPDQWDKWQD
jgi:hypothetical protein